MLLLSFIVIIPLLLFILNFTPNTKSTSSSNSKYDDLESAFSNYTNLLLEDGVLSMDSVIKDLDNFKSSEDKFGNDSFLNFEDKHVLLNALFLDNTINYLELSTNKENYMKSIQLDVSRNISAHMSFDSTDPQLSLLNSIDSTFDIDIIKNNKENLDYYRLYLETLNKEGSISIDRCRSLLNLKLYEVDEVADMSGVFKFGYLEIYEEGNFTITTCEDIVVDVMINLKQSKSDIIYSVLLSTDNDFIHSEENKINIFVFDKDINDLLNSHHTTMGFINIYTDYDKEVTKEDFNKLYDDINSFRFK